MFIAATTAPTGGHGMADKKRASAEESVPVYRRCPLCWQRCRGVGISYSTQQVTDCVSTRYYKCARTLTEHPPCGHTWSARVKMEVTKIEHRLVEISKR